MTTPDDVFVCFCVGVRKSRIIQAVRQGAKTVEDVRRACSACTGCQSCWGDIEAIIREEQERAAKPQ